MRKGRIAELDVLRGMAAVTVVIYHHVTIFDETLGRGPRTRHIPYGVFAVHLFFMISGFVIFMSLDRTRTALDFVVSRFSRLFPAFWAAVLLTQTVLWLAPFADLAVSWWEAFVNLTMLGEPLHVRLVDNVYWSLVVEIAFYSIMLLLFVAGSLKHIERLVAPWLLLQLLAKVAASAFHQTIPKGVAILLLLKYAHLFLGGILCYRMRFEAFTRKRLGLFICCLFTQFIIHGFWAGVFAIAFFALFYALAKDWLQCLSVRPLIFIGTISYSLYLIHQNIGIAIMRELANYPRLLQLLVAEIVVFTLAAGLTFGVEQPAMAMARNWYRSGETVSNR